LASIDHTAYPRFKRVVSGRELSEVFSPTQDELAWARERTQNDRHLLALVVGLKSYQRLGYFPRLADVPAAVIDHGCFLVAVEDGQIVGCIGLRPCGDGAWVLDNFAVSPSRHGRGLGSRLVSSAIDAASCDGPSVIYTATTHTDGWFTRHGFVDTTKDRVAADWAATLDPSRPSRLFVRSFSPISAEVTHPSTAPPESAMRSGAG